MIFHQVAICFVVLWNIGVTEFLATCKSPAAADFMI